MPVRLCCIVEGHGEVKSVPALIHRICIDRQVSAPIVPTPIRWDRHRLVKPGEAERAVQVALKFAGAAGGVLILVDADDDCPAKIGPLLMQRAASAAGGVPFAVSLACREYESWFLAAAEGFRSFRGLPASLEAPGNFQEIRGAKEWLRKMAGTGSSYRPTVDQLLFTRQMDLQLARRSRSFVRFERELLKLLERLDPRQATA